MKGSHARSAYFYHEVPNFHFVTICIPGNLNELFYPRPFGLRVLSLPATVCVCLSVCQFLLVRAITHHPLKLGSPIGPKDAKHFAEGPYCFRGWLGLIFQVKCHFISKSCFFASRLHLWNICETCKNGWKHVCSTSWMAAHISVHPKASCHGPWNSRVVSLMWPLLASLSWTRRFGNEFWMLLWAFTKSDIPHMLTFCMPIFGNGRNKSETVCICLYCLQVPKLGYPA